MAFQQLSFNVDVTYLDFAKAFNKLDIKIALEKMKKLGINNKIFKWIEAFLNDRKQKVIVNGINSEPVNVKSGVPQGSVLGPLIFLIHIGDIDYCVENSIIRSFADDTRIVGKVESYDDVANIQDDLQTIYDWTEISNMTFNETKFELLRYGTNDLLKVNTEYISPSGKVIDAKQEVKDLGIHMTDDASFDYHITQIAEKAKHMTSWILRTFKTRESLPMLTLWKSLVIPILEYCSVLWSPSTVGNIQRLEMLQWSFIRKIVDRKNRNYWDLLKFFNLYSLQRRRERYMIIYLWKIIEKKVKNINNKITCIMKNRDEKYTEEPS